MCVKLFKGVSELHLNHNVEFFSRLCMDKEIVCIGASSSGLFEIVSWSLSGS